MTDDLACIQVVELVTEYLEGAMPPAAARALEHHLATCPGCTEYLEQMRSTTGALSSLREDALPPGIRENLIAAFRRSRP
jgi:anti-sigma factor RsiW